VSKPIILYAETDPDLLSEQAEVFRRAGYQVKTAVGRRGMEAALKQERFDVAILGHTLSKDDRHHLPYMIKKVSEDIGVLVLHNSGRHHAVDLAIDSRRGNKAVLEAIASLGELVTA